MGAQLDDIGDIYDHSGIFKEKGDKEFQEVGDRKIRGNIADDEYDEKVYASKKVTRAEREKQAESSEDQYSEEGEAEMEEGEAELDEDMSSLEDFEIQNNRKILDKLQTKEDKKSHAQIDNILKKLKDDEQEESKYDKKQLSSDIQKAKSVTV